MHNTFEYNKIGLSLIEYLMTNDHRKSFQLYKQLAPAIEKGFLDVTALSCNAKLSGSHAS